MVLNGFDDDDGVVHDDADREDKPEEREAVHRVPEHGHRRERADDGDRHRGQRDDRRPPRLEEHEHDDRDQDDGVAERLEHLVDGLIDERGGVVHDLVVQARLEPGLELGHLVAHPLGGVDGVGPGQLVHGQRHRRLAVERAGLIVTERAKFDLRHVLEPHRPVVVGFQDDFAELPGIGQPAHCVDRVLERLAARRGRLAHLPGGDLRVLLLDGPQHVGRGELLHRHLVRVEPHPHRVVALAQVRNVAHALQPGEFVAQLDGRVVAQVQEQLLPRLVVFRRRGGTLQVDNHQLAGRLLFHHDAAPLHEVRQHRFREADAVLHEHLRDVQVDARLERDGERVRPVVPAGGGHVHHVLDAVHLLFDGGGHGVGHGARICAGVDSVHLNGGRGDVRVLRDRTREQPDESRQRDDDGQHAGEDRSVDEEAGEHMGWLSVDSGCTKAQKRPTNRVRTERSPSDLRTREFLARSRMQH